MPAFDAFGNVTGAAECDPFLDFINDLPAYRQVRRPTKIVMTVDGELRIWDVMLPCGAVPVEDHVEIVDDVSRLPAA